jgi:hypothetical protein
MLGSGVNHHEPCNGQDAPTQEKRGIHADTRSSGSRTPFGKFTPVCAKTPSILADAHPEDGDQRMYC